MKLGKLLKRIRLLPLTGERQKLVDRTDDALAAGRAGSTGPPSWVPSQQDERQPN